MLSACFSTLFPSAVPTSMMNSLSTSSVSLLILGAGWTGTFLLPHLKTHHPVVTFAATTRDGRDGTIQWTWDSEAKGPDQFKGLPRAETVLVVFPIKGEGGSRRLVEGYEEAVGVKVRWIQLGSTGIFDGGPTLAGRRAAGEDFSSSPPFKWTDRHSPYDTSNARAVAEDELLSLHEETYVLNLSGLWGGSRIPTNWISKVAPTYEALEAKGSIHLIHGEDVARAIVAVHLSSPRSTSTEKSTSTMQDEKPHPKGERFILTDLRVYDWWDLVAAYATTSSALSETPEAAFWVQRLIRKHHIRALPRTPEEIGRALDSRDFWERFELMPSRGRFDPGRA
ncbi:hypothetical protein JCM11251_005298 [Rhodosporidiobolus azoricus]